MDLQSSVNVAIAYHVETALNAQAGSGGGQLIRRVSSSLALTKGAFSSQEVRPDQEIFDARHGTRRVAGAIAGELSTQTYDDFIEAVLRGTWATGSTITQATAGMSSATLAATASSSRFTASAGSFLTAGLKIGDVFRMNSGHNTGVNFRITALTATVMTVHPAPADASAAGTWSLTVQGKVLVPGTTKRSFTIEQSHPDIDVTEVFTGCRFGDMSLQVPPNGMVGVNFGVMGVDAQFLSGASAPYFTAPGAVAGTRILAGVTGSCHIAGTQVAILTGLNLSVTNNLSSDPVVFNTTVPDIFYGSTVITGDISFYLRDTTMLDYFDDETEVAVSFQLDDANGGFMAVTMPRVKLLGAGKQVGPNGGVVVQSQFQALRAESVTGYRDGSICIQRSNT